MATVSDLYEAKYGLTVKILLRMLGGNPDVVLSKMQEKVDSPSEADREFFGVLNIAPLTAADAADASHHLMVAEVERLYFTSIGRASAVAICNALSKSGACGTISIHADVPELTYTATTFMCRWNENHPGEQEIVEQSGFEI